jgi:hypothetical protein
VNQPHQPSAGACKVATAAAHPAVVHPQRHTFENTREQQSMQMYDVFKTGKEDDVAWLQLRPAAATLQAQNYSACEATHLSVARS